MTSGSRLQGTPAPDHADTCTAAEPSNEWLMHCLTGSQCKLCRTGVVLVCSSCCLIFVFITPGATVVLWITMLSYVCWVDIAFFAFERPVVCNTYIGTYGPLKVVGDSLSLWIQSLLTSLHIRPMQCGVRHGGGCTRLILNGVVRIDPLHFLAGCRKRSLNQALSFLVLVVLCVFFCADYYGHFLCIGSLHFCVFCLLVVLVNLSVLAKWLARKTHLRVRLHGKEIISTKPRLKSDRNLWFFMLLHCLLCVCRLSCGPTEYIPLYSHGTI